MLKVLDLFAGTQSVRKALDQMKIEYDYKGVDIYPPNILLDLRSDEVLKELQMVLGRWKPNFIWASPVCLSFSRATGIKNGTLAWEMDGKDDIRLRKNFATITHSQYVKDIHDPKWQAKQRQKGVDGLRMLNNTKLIVRHYDVPFAIENPAHALSKYLMKGFVRNVADYCAYGFDYKKPTAIYSNVSLNLKRCTCREIHKARMKFKPQANQRPVHASKVDNLNGNQNRSQVPLGLIIDIIEQSLDDHEFDFTKGCFNCWVKEHKKLRGED